MAQKLINVGVTANDGSGDAIRQAGIHINNNFTEVYDFAPVKSDIRFTGNVISTESSNADIDLSASGAGLIKIGAGIQIDDNNIKTIRSNDDLRIIPSGSGKLVIAGIGFSGTTMTADDSSSININENLIVSGTASVSGATTFSGAVSLDLTTLGVTGLTTLTNVTAMSIAMVGTTTVDNITFNDNIIATSSNADLNLTPGGTGLVTFPAFRFNGNNIEATRSNDDIKITPSGTGDVVLSALRVNGTTLDSSDSSKITLAEAVDITGAVTITSGTITGITDLAVADGGTGASSLTDNAVLTGTGTSAITAEGNLSFNGSTLAVTGNITATGTSTIDNLTFNDNIIGSSSNADINLTPGGTGNVVLSSSLDFGSAVLSNGTATHAGSSGQQPLDEFTHATYRSAKYVLSLIHI